MIETVVVSGVMGVFAALFYGYTPTEALLAMIFVAIVLGQKEGK